MISIGVLLLFLKSSNLTRSLPSFNIRILLINNLSVTWICYRSVHINEYKTSFDTVEAEIGQLFPSQSKFKVSSIIDFWAKNSLISHIKEIQTLIAEYIIDNFLLSRCQMERERVQKSELDYISREPWCHHWLGKERLRWICYAHYYLLLLMYSSHYLFSYFYFYCHQFFLFFAQILLMPHFFQGRELQKSKDWRKFLGKNRWKNSNIWIWNNELWHPRSNNQSVV